MAANRSRRGISNTRTVMHNFDQVSWNGSRYPLINDALEDAFKAGFREVILLSDSEKSFWKKYYRADAEGKWLQVEPF